MNKDSVRIFAVFLLWFLIINIFAVIVSNRFNLSKDTAYNWIDDNVGQEKSWNPIPLHANWDSEWYLDIVDNGYHLEGEYLQNVVFFPLYPFLIKLVSFLMAGNVVLAGWFLSSLFLFLSLFYLFKIVKEFHQEVSPDRAIIALLIFPTAFFFNAVYTESLFLFLSLLTFYYSLKGRFLSAGIFGLLASLTRVTGLLLLVPVFWEYLRRHQFKIKSVLTAKFLPVMLVPFGTLGFFLYHYFRFGDFLLFFRIQEEWGRKLWTWKESVELLTNPSVANFALDVFFVLVIILAIYFIFKIRFSYGLYVLATVLLPLSTGTMMSIGRYILVLFPIYILSASIKNKFVWQAWAFTSVLLMALYTILFVNNYWAG